MSVGEHFICQQIDNQCIENPIRVEDEVIPVLDINALEILLRMLGFHASTTDIHELKTWLLDNDCFISGPDFDEDHIILIIRDRLLELLKLEKNHTFKANAEELRINALMGRDQLSNRDNVLNHPYSSFETSMAKRILAKPISEAIGIMEGYEA